MISSAASPDSMSIAPTSSLRFTPNFFAPEYESKVDVTGKICWIGISGHLADLPLWLAATGYKKMDLVLDGEALYFMFT